MVLDESSTERVLLFKTRNFVINIPVFVFSSLASIYFDFIVYRTLTLFSHVIIVLV